MVWPNWIGLALTRCHECIWTKESMWLWTHNQQCTPPLYLIFSMPKEKDGTSKTGPWMVYGTDLWWRKEGTKNNASRLFKNIDEKVCEDSFYFKTFRHHLYQIIFLILNNLRIKFPCVKSGINLIGGWMLIAPFIGCVCLRNKTPYLIREFHL